MSGKVLSRDIHFSLEVFPPKTEAGLDKLLHTVDAYTALKPSTITVTFTAGNAPESVTYMRDLLVRISARTAIPVAAHLVCAGRSRTEIDSILDTFWNDGVRRIVALRGDILAQNGAYRPHPEGYSTTIEFIAAIHARYPSMTILVAGYPEMHPESPSLTFDLDHLKKKVDAGASRVLTQFFFDPEIFLRWRDKVVAHGINVPIIPGLLPILSFPKMLGFAKKCNANVPDFLYKMFDGVDPDSVDHKLLAMNVLSHQITRLIEHGVTSFHFYTLNDTLLTRHLCTWLRTAFQDLVDTKAGQ
jgi:methylenetetrahydrofolate reductase (NADPH)